MHRKYLAIIAILLFSFVGDALALTKYQDVVQDRAGNAVSGALVDVYLAGTTTSATLYTSASGAVATSNPATTDSNGSFSFFVADGLYDFTITKTGMTTQTKSSVVIVGNKPYIDISDYPSLTLAEAAAYAAGKTLYCASSYTIGSAVTISASFRAEKGCTLTKSGSGTIAFSGPFDAGLYQVFSGFSAGDVTGLKLVRPEWFLQNTTPGTTDMYSALTQAAYLSSNGAEMLLQPVTYLTSGKISFSKPPTVKGTYSPPVVLGGERKGSVILSTVANDYAVEINTDGTYRRGVYLKDFHILSTGAGTTGYGLNIVNCGWGGEVSGVVVEGFAKIGVRLSQVQDSIFNQLEILKCGTDNTYPALYITGGSNQLSFFRPRLELNEYTMLIDSASFAINFFASHIESGDYPGELLGPDAQVIPMYSSMRFSSVTGIKFFGGTITPATIGSTMTKYSITAAQCPYFITATASTDVVFDGVTIGPGYDRGKTIKFDSSDGNINSCNFPFATVEDYSLYLKGNIFFSENNVALYDTVALATAFYGIYGEGVLVKDNILSAANGGTSTKLSGYVFASSASNRMKLGQNSISISKYYLFHDSNLFIYGYQPDEFLVSDFTGTVDSRLFNPHSVLVTNTSGTMTLITGSNTNQEYSIQNFYATPLTLGITHGGGMVLKGGVNASLSKYSTINIKYDGINGTHNEVNRNF